MDEDQIEQIVATSRRMQEVGEFIAHEESRELFEELGLAVLRVAASMREKTELGDDEIAAACVGSVTAVLIGWIRNRPF